MLSFTPLTLRSRRVSLSGISEYVVFLFSHGQIM
jgi:hypothetical protein